MRQLFMLCDPGRAPAAARPGGRAGGDRSQQDRRPRRLGGARVERVTQPEKDMLLLALRNNGQNYKLILSASPSFARAHLTKGQFINPIDAPMFCMLMRKHLSGGRLMEISQLNGDRVLLLRFEAQDELGDASV